VSDQAKTSGTSPPPQADTIRVSVASVMRNPFFREGVKEYRARKRPNFDKHTDGAWEYERGRQWAVIAKRKGHPDLEPRGRFAAYIYNAGVCP
jgi:hypothetical protein